MADDRSLFERLDSMEAQLNEILSLSSKNTNEPKQNATVNTNKPTEKQLLEKFLRQSKKSWMWFGTKIEFNKVKRMAIISSLVLLIVGLITSIVTSVVCKFYTTFTLFENIWMFLCIFSLSYQIKSKRIYQVNEMAEHSQFRSKFDSVGMIFFDKEKKKYKVFRWFAIISAIANIITVWAWTQEFSLVSTVVELLFLGLIILEYFMNAKLFLQYSIVYVEGNNLSTNERVVLVLPPGAKNLITEEEFKKKMPMLYE